MLFVIFSSGSNERCHVYIGRSVRKEMQFGQVMIELVFPRSHEMHENYVMVSFLKERIPLCIGQVGEPLLFIYLSDFNLQLQVP